MGRKWKRIGIMGGTFDPIHYGHLVAAEEARWRFDLEVVIFVPAGQPPHKPSEGITDKEHRYNMVVLATCPNPYFLVSRVEIDRPGPSYAIDTVREFKRKLGQDVEIYFITGADAVLEILTWREAERLVELCDFIAATRPGYDLEAMYRELPEKFLKHIHPLPIPGMAISSTEIRRRVREGLPIRYLTPEPVEQYILKHGLYKEPAEAKAGTVRHGTQGP
ncbi:MAG TPA: nicotinate-nucleotide adenylyltransferase [Armatimonadetes bacterium]|nr:nicotinate-nucleotide adenylyltransferase [Armatimonadota bacterium]